MSRRPRPLATGGVDRFHVGMAAPAVAALAPARAEMPAFFVDYVTEHGEQRARFTLDMDRPLAVQLPLVVEELRRRGEILAGSPDDELVASWSGRALPMESSPALLGITPARPLALEMRGPQPRTARASRCIGPGPVRALHGATAAMLGLVLLWILQDLGLAGGSAAAELIAGALMGGAVLGVAYASRGAGEARSSAEAMRGGALGVLLGSLAAGMGVLLAGAWSERIVFGPGAAVFAAWGVLGVALGLGSPGWLPGIRGACSAAATGGLAGLFAGGFLSLPVPGDLAQAIAAGALGATVAVVPGYASGLPTRPLGAALLAIPVGGLLLSASLLTGSELPLSRRSPWLHRCPGVPAEVCTAFHVRGGTEPLRESRTWHGRLGRQHLQLLSARPVVEPGTYPRLFVLVDVSGSMRGPASPEVHRALLRFLALLPDSLEVAVVPGWGVESLGRIEAAAYLPPSIAAREIHALPAPGRGTALYPAVLMAATRLVPPRGQPGSSGRLLVITDGEDDLSDIPGAGAPLWRAEQGRAALTRAVRRLGVRVDVVGIGATVDTAALRGLASEGGRLFQVQDAGGLSHLLDDVARDLGRVQELIFKLPASVPAVGGYPRRLRLRDGASDREWNAVWLPPLFSRPAVAPLLREPGRSGRARPHPYRTAVGALMVLLLGTAARALPTRNLAPRRCPDPPGPRSAGRVSLPREAPPRRPSEETAPDLPADVPLVRDDPASGGAASWTHRIPSSGVDPCPS